MKEELSRKPSIVMDLELSNLRKLLRRLHKAESVFSISVRNLEKARNDYENAFKEIMNG
jgi:hypothetical protein